MSEGAERLFGAEPDIGQWHQPERTTEQNLWAAVLVQMVEDGLSAKPLGPHDHDRRIARSWFTDPGFSKDFAMVCDMAGFDPQFIRDRFKNLLAEQEGNPTPHKPGSRVRRISRPPSVFTITSMPKQSASPLALTSPQSSL